MGFTMDLVDSAFRIRKEKVPGALQALKRLIDSPTDSDSDLGPISGWREKLAKSKTLQEALGLWAWEVNSNVQRDVIGISIIGGGKKYLNDDFLFETIAPFVEKGSFIEMEGEDRSLWRWEFDGERVVTKERRVIYE